MSETLAERYSKDKLYSRNKSMEQLVSEAIDDGKIDVEEASRLQRKFIYENECSKEQNENCKIELKKETAQKLLDLAVEGGFNTLAIKIQERFIGLEKPKENIYSFFGIPREGIQKIEKKCSEYGINFDIAGFLKGYKDYFQKNLSGLDENIVGKIKEIIRLKIFKINKILDERIKFVDEQISKGNYKPSDRKNEIHNQRWIINSMLQDELSFLNNSVIPSAGLLAKVSRGEKIDKTSSMQISNRTGSVNSVDVEIIQARKMFESDIDGNGDFENNKLNPNFTQNRLIDLKRNYDSKVADDNDINLGKVPSILSEQDKEIETQAQYYFMAAVGAQIFVEVGPAVLLSYFPGFGTAAGAIGGAVVGGTVDVGDMFSDTEILLDMVQNMGFVDPNYRMNKTIIDNILAGIGIIPGATAVVKGKALGEFLRKIPPDKQGKFEETMFKILDKIRPKNVEKIGEVTYEISRGRLIIHEIGENLSKDDFLKIVNKLKEENVGITKIDISQIKDEKKASEARKLLSETLSENFPALSIERLISGQRVVDISFSGGKHLNDYVSKEFCDLLVAKFKDRVKGNVKKAGAPPNHREVRSDYKHHTVTFDVNEDFTKMLFGGNTDRKEFIKEILAEISDSELHEIFEIIKKDPESTKKLNYLGLNTNSSTTEIRNAISKEVEGNFDFGIGTSIVDGEKFEDKSKAFYEAETSAKRGIKDGSIKAKEFSFDRVKDFADEALSIEDDLVRDYKDHFVQIGGNFFKIIVTDRKTGEAIINPILLRHIRKDGEIASEKLQALVKQYIGALNEGFDFISPIVRGVEKNITELDESIRKGEVPVESLTHNNKGTHTKKALQMEIEGKPGTRAFVDIVDMGIMNLMDFRELAKKVRKGEITESKMMELLEAGGSVTQTFQKFVKGLEEHGIKISLGGDEGFMYSEKLSPDELSKIIAEELDKSGLRGRVTFSTDVNDSKKIFDGLDSSTGQIKPIEQFIEGTILNEPELVNKGITVPSSIMLRVKEGTKIPEGISGMINKEKILELYRTGTSNIGDGISLTRIKNQITININ